MRMHISIILLLLTAMAVNAAEEKLEITADIMRGEMTSNGPARILEGNVHLKQGETSLYCQHAIWYVDQHYTILEQNVKYDDGLKVLTADKVIYDDANKVLNAIGHVVLIDSVRTIRSDRAVYYDVTDKITASSNVTLFDRENNVTLTGEYADFIQERGYATITGDPVLVKRDSTGNEEIRVKGIKMELIDDSDLALVTDSVKIIHRDGTAYCDTAKFDRSQNILRLIGQPRVLQKYDRSTGDEIQLFFHKNDLDSVIIIGNAVVTSPVDTLDVAGRLNRLLGERITLKIENNQLKTVQVNGRATSYYYIFEKDEYRGMNKIIGDRIVMDLKDRKIDTIIIESDPESSTGIYYPPEVDIRNEPSDAEVSAADL
ncbi:hypothetical protein JXB12_12630 [candidate division KSB1 bacterium]|nr:hypothetical protein [candidate division KSB1 bacterium]